MVDSQHVRFRAQPRALTVPDTISFRVAGITRRVSFSRGTLRLRFLGTHDHLDLKMVSKKTKNSGDAVAPMVGRLELGEGDSKICVYARSLSTFAPGRNSYFHVQLSLREFDTLDAFPSKRQRDAHALAGIPVTFGRTPTTFPDQPAPAVAAIPVEFHSGGPRRRAPRAARFVDKVLRFIAWCMSAIIQLTLGVVLCYAAVSCTAMFITIPIDAFGTFTATVCPFAGPRCDPAGGSFTCVTSYNQTTIDYNGAREVKTLTNRCYTLAPMSDRSQDMVASLYETDSVLFTMVLFLLIVTYSLYALKAVIALFNWCMAGTDAIVEQHSRTTRSVKEAVMPYFDRFFEWLGLAGTPAAFDFTETQAMELLVGANASVGRFESILNDPATSKYGASNAPPAAISFSAKIDGKLHVVGWGTRVQLSGKTYTATCLHVISDAEEMGEGEVWLSGTSQVDGKTVSVRYPPETRRMATLYSSDQVLLEIPQRVYAQLGVKAVPVGGLKHGAHVTMYTPNLERPGKWVLQVTRTEPAKGSKRLPGQFYHTADTVHGSSGLGCYQGKYWIGTHSAGSADGLANVGFSSNLIKVLDAQFNSDKESWTEDVHWAAEFRISELEAAERHEDDYYVIQYEGETWFIDAAAAEEEWRLQKMADEFERQLSEEENEWDHTQDWALDRQMAEEEYDDARYAITQWLEGPSYYESNATRKFLHKFLKKMNDSREEHLKVTGASSMVHAPSSGSPPKITVKISPKSGQSTFMEELQRLRTLSSPSMQSTPAPPSLERTVRPPTPIPQETAQQNSKASSSNTEEPEKPTGIKPSGEPQSSSTGVQLESGPRSKKKLQRSSKGKGKEVDQQLLVAQPNIPSTDSSAKLSQLSKSARRKLKKKAAKLREKSRKSACLKQSLPLLDSTQNPS